METTATFAINEVGEKSGNPYTGTFVVKTMLTRRDGFTADAIRRNIVGVDPQNASPSIAGEAFMLGQLSVRIIDAPKWWEESDGGMDLADVNVIATIFKEAMDAESKRLKKLEEETKIALKKLKKED